MSVALRLLEHVRAAAPAVEDVSVGTPGDSATVRVHPAGQQAAARAAIAAFDWSNAAHAQWEEDRQPERNAVRSAVAQAVAEIDVYLATADGGTAAQIQARDHAQFKRVNQYLRTALRRLAQID